MPALLFIALMLIAQTTSYAEAQDRSQPIIHARRGVEILEGGLLTVNDTFALEAPRGERVLITSLKVGFHAPFTSERRSFYVSSNGDWRPLEYHETDLGEPGFHGYDLELSYPVVLEDGSTLKIMASYLFVDRVWWDGGGYSARIPVYPAVPYNLSSFVIQVELPEGAEFNEVDSPLAFTNSSEGGRWTLTHESGMLTPLLNENMTVTYTPAPEDEYLLDCELMQRRISIKPGRLRLEDTYIITNRGAILNRFHLKLPRGTSNIRARDGVGPLKVVSDVAEDDGAYVDLYVSPRSSVRWRGRWSFTVEYSVPSGEHIDDGGGRFILTYPAHNTNRYVRRFVVVATLPEGGSFIASEPEPTSVKKDSAFTQQVIMDLRGVMPSELPRVVVEYGWSAIWSALRPLVWALIAAGAVASVYILRRRRRAVEVEPAAIPSDLEDFLNLYRERVALLAEQEELERGLERKEIGREHFDRRSAEITRRQRELLRTLRRLEGSLKTADPRIGEGLLGIRKAEAELDKVNTDLRNLEVRLRARRVSRRDYKRRRRDYIRRRSRARKRIEQVIAALRAES